MTLARGKKLNNNRYIIGQELGRGGFGVTYKAWDNQENKLVVIKVVHDYFQSADDYQSYLQRFKREIKILQELKTKHKLNAHILEWHDSFVEKIANRNVDCLVTEFIPGNNLYNFIKIQGRLTEVQAIKIAHQIGSALQILHKEHFDQSETLVHRDVHPGNIILGDNGEAVLIDFGLSRHIADHDHSTVTIAGNPKFAPCEQMIVGSTKPTVDIYSLAATLYYTLTKKCPPNYLERYENHDWLKFPDQIPEISNQLKAAILKGLEFKPDNRPQSIEAWLKLLPQAEQFNPTKPISSKPHEISVSPSKSEPTSKKLVIYSIAATVAMFGLGIWGLLNQHKLQIKIEEHTQLQQRYRHLNDLIENKTNRKTSTLKSIRERGHLICGIDGDIPGFSYLDVIKDIYFGLDVDICKAIAAAIFTDPSDKVKYVEVNAEERFAELKKGNIDILSRNTTVTLGRDFHEGVEFAPIIFYDQQGIMVRKDSGIEELEDFQGKKICVEKSTTAEANIKALTKTRNIQVEIKSVGIRYVAYQRYYDKICQGIIADQSQLVAKISKRGDVNNHRRLRLDKPLSKEPLAPVIIENDPDWYDMVEWTVFALIEAEELGITQDNVEAMRRSDNPKVRCFLGVDTNCHFGAILGLSNDFAARIIKHVGNYGEIYERNLGQYDLFNNRGYNQLWKDGGLLYSPPFF